MTQFASAVSKFIYTPYPKTENAKKIISRTLIIEKREVDEDTAEKLKKKNPHQLKFENDYNNFFNERLLELFQKEFFGSKDIITKTTSEVEQLLDSKSTKYVILRNQNMERSFQVNRSFKDVDTYTFSLILPDLKKEQLMISFTYDILSDPDFTFLIQQINDNLQRASKGEESIELDDINDNRAAQLKGKKLIITDKLLNPKLTLEDIKKVYKLDIEYITDNSKYNEIISNKTPGYAYITSAFTPLTMGTCYFVVNTENGNILEAMSLGGVTFSISTRPSKAMMPYASKADRSKFTVDLLTLRPTETLKEKHFEYLNKLASKKK